MNRLAASNPGRSYESLVAEIVDRGDDLRTQRKYEKLEGTDQRPPEQDEEASDGR